MDPRLTQSVGLYQFAGLVGSRLVRYAFPDEVTGPSDMSLKGDLAESWTSTPDARVWTFKLRQGVKWHNVAPLNGREFVAADVKYCLEAYAKEGAQSFTFQEVEGIETPDKHTVRIHLKTPNVLFPQNVAEPITVIFSREVLEEDGDLKKRMIGTGPFILKEHNRKVRVVLDAQSGLLGQGPPVRGRVRDPLDPGRGDPDGRVPNRAERLHLAREPLRGGDASARRTPSAIVQSYHNTLTPFGMALAQDKPPFNDVRVRRALSMAIDRQKQVDTIFEGHGILGWGVPVHLLPGQAAHRWPSSARGGSTAPRRPRSSWPRPGTRTASRPPCSTTSTSRR